MRVIDPVAVGDRVVFSEGADDRGMIREVRPRSNKVSRRASGGSYREQLLAANVDQVVPIVSAGEPEPDWILLDRMIGIAEWQQIPVSLCLNKLDLADEAWADQVMGPYRAMGYPVVYTSIISDAGKEAFYGLLRGKITLFMGLLALESRVCSIGCNPGCNCVQDLLARLRARAYIRRRIRNWSRLMGEDLSAICPVFESFICTI